MSISAPRDCAGLTGPENEMENAHVSPGAKDERVTPDQASSVRLVIHLETHCHT